MSEKDLDAKALAHIQRMGSLARTAADSQITSYREQAGGKPQVDGDVALDPTSRSRAPVRYEEIKAPLTGEAILLSYLLREFPTPRSFREAFTQ